MQVFQHVINGQDVPSEDGAVLNVVCPSDGEVFATICAGGRPEIDSAVGAARTAFEGSWGAITAVERGRFLHRISELVQAHALELAELEARDTGKPLAQAQVDITCTARYFEYYGAAADKVHGDTIPFLSGYQAFTLYEPYGVTGHIIPWNYPAQMVGRSVAASLAMGNAVVLKPAEEASGTPLRLAHLAREAGLPDGAFNVVTGLGETAGAALAAHRGVNFMSFTGSPEVGALVQTAAAQNHIGCTLELGGKSPQILFDDANLEAALPVVVNAIVQNGGQTCSAGSRVLIQETIYGQVAEWLTEAFENLVAAPWDAGASLGALISSQQKARVEHFISQGGGVDAPLLARGKIAGDAPQGGNYVAPALFGPVERDHVLAREEVFGPVLSLIPFVDETDAIGIANDTEYGLVAGVWTENGGRQMRVAKAVKAGQVFVNGYGAGGGIELPFGGVGKSGHGREKGFVALHEFAQIKTIVQKHD